MSVTRSFLQVSLLRPHDTVGLDYLGTGRHSRIQGLRKTSRISGAEAGGEGSEAWGRDPGGNGSLSEGVIYEGHLTVRRDRI